MLGSLLWWNLNSLQATRYRIMSKQWLKEPLFIAVILWQCFMAAQLYQVTKYFNFDAKQFSCSYRFLKKDFE